MIAKIRFNIFLWLLRLTRSKDIIMTEDEAENLRCPHCGRKLWTPHIVEEE